MYPRHQDALSADPGGCHAAAECVERACFQVRVEASLGRRMVRHRANACAAHIGELVEGVKAWANDGNLTDGTRDIGEIDYLVGAARRALRGARRRP
jgi:hypothetical protein